MCYHPRITQSHKVTTCTDWFAIVRRICLLWKMKNNVFSHYLWNSLLSNEINIFINNSSSLDLQRQTNLLLFFFFFYRLNIFFLFRKKKFVGWDLKKKCLRLIEFAYLLLTYTVILHPIWNLLTPDIPY